MTLSEVVERYGVDPEQTAARPWLWGIGDDGRLWLVAGLDTTFDHHNYDGSRGMVGGPYSEHFWKPLDA